MRCFLACRADFSSCWWRGRLRPTRTSRTFAPTCSLSCSVASFFVRSSEDEEGGKKKKVADDRGRDAHIYDDAIRFIEQHKGGPFYVNVWGHIPHNPVNPTDALVKRWSGLKVKDSDFPPQVLGKFDDVRKAGGDVDDGMRRYLADIESLDDAVGRILKTIDQLGLRENTIVVFNSDQGASIEAKPVFA